MASLASLRKDYSLAGLAEADLARDPFRQFDKWFQEAEAANVIEPNAMTLATVDSDGTPRARTMLLKSVDGRGFVFFTNYESAKGRDLTTTPRATLLFPWLALERQVIATGTVTKISREETDAYFQSRPLGSQFGAWASPQSTVVPSRKTLEDNLRAVESRYAGQPVPTPPHWGGYCLNPATVDFWQGRRNRLHDRLRYRRADQDWVIERLAP
ncbi:pyridoxamine 5'-phosphate oxidase [Synoicihabitans lomoniglobus]|uniref:Pyridoxamine 5'-phosphate oxidase n=1 Tax=Synoicihabitans lomoniglobus TaxID=2909285 RepID=A0AAE9ZST3_9BACT|nr:pyridoxamine 5'-phosphate oxidase [Opitutaceae bacterium LMO-M01]WED64560.1 pyridoxamine 5'-phosphate oxidase [Opitutaceae bacterium LMO-M01]